MSEEYVTIERDNLKQLENTINKYAEQGYYVDQYEMCPSGKRNSSAKYHYSVIMRRTRS